jgi:hypothetical protein
LALITSKFRTDEALPPTSFTLQALKRWELIPGEARKRLLRDI